LVFDKFPDDVGTYFANKHRLTIWTDSEVVRLVKSLPEQYTSISQSIYVGKKELIAVGQTYPHMPILRSHAARFHERRISSATFASAHLYGNIYMRMGLARALTDSAAFGFLGEQSSQKCEIPCLGRR